MIPFIDLAAQQKAIKEKLEKRIQDVLAHGQYIMGPEVSELEKELAEFAGVNHAISCSSGTDALLMPLMAYGIGPGHAIFTTPFTFISTAEVIALLGATPVFVDIDPKTFNMDPQKLELAIEAISKNDQSIYPLPVVPKSTTQNPERRTQNAERRTQNAEPPTPNPPLFPRGIIAVDLFGLPANYDQINATARDSNLFVLEDAAQSFGGTYGEKRAGALADVAATSFFPAKPLGCYGDGGAVLTDHAELADTMRSIRNHGQGKEKYDNVRIGINGRLDTMQAAILLEKLAIFPKEIEARNHAAQKYSEGLKGYVGVPSVPPGYTSAWAQYSVLSENREELQAVLKENGIPTAIYYPKPLHLQTAFAALGYHEGNFPVSEEISKKIFSLPMHPYLKDEVIEKIVGVIKSY